MLNNHKPERRIELLNINGLLDRKYPLIMIGKSSNLIILKLRVRVKKEKLNGILSMIRMEGDKESE
jgi:hypothetical protein